MGDNKTILGFPRGDFLFAAGAMVLFWSIFVGIVVGMSPY